MIPLEQKGKLTDTNHFIGLWVDNPLFKKETERCQEGSRRRGREGDCAFSITHNIETVVSKDIFHYFL